MGTPTRARGGAQVKLERRDYLTLFVFSLLFNVNIWLSNYSLNLVTMAMHQVVRAMVPAFTVMLSVPLLGKRYVVAWHASYSLPQPCAPSLLPALIVKLCTRTSYGKRCALAKSEDSA